MGKSRFKETTLKKINTVLESLREGAPLIGACKRADLSRTAFYDWVAEKKENRQQYHSILDERSGTVEDALYKAAMGGNTTAQIFWLKNRVPERWADRVEQVIEQRMSLDEAQEHLSELYGLNISSN